MPGAKLAVLQPDKSISAIPTFVDPFVLFYRKDLYDQKGWKAPKTLAEMESQAKALHGPPGMYGIVYRGPQERERHALGVHALRDGRRLPHEGREVRDQHARVDEDHGPLRGHAPPVRPAGRRELQLVRVPRPPSCRARSASTSTASTSPTSSRTRRSRRSRARSGYAVLPAGPAGHHTCTFTNAMAVSAQSKNKEAAYLFCCWSTNKQNAVRELLAGVGVGRASTWTHPEVKAKPKMPQAWYDAYLESLKIGKPGLPEIVQRHRVPGHHRRRHPEGDRGRAVGAGAGGRAQGLPGPPEPHRKLDAIRTG